MPVITLLGGSFCRNDLIISRLIETTGYTLIDDQQVLDRAVTQFQAQETRLRRAFSGKISAFNKFTHEWQRSLAILKMAVAEFLSQDGLIIHGLASLLIPRDISHVLKVCLVGDLAWRNQEAVTSRGLKPKEAADLIQKDDETAATWSGHQYGKSPWDAKLYDLLIPVDKTDISTIVALIQDNSRRAILLPTDESLRAVADFRLAARVEDTLTQKGHDVGVVVQDGIVTLIINKHVLLLSRLENELKKIIGALAGVKGVQTRIGAGFHQADVYRQADLEAPSRVLLVDDETEFVQTLSERLMMRDMGSTVVYDGEQALSFVQEEEPDVMVLDLKMPGIDGIEVLRRIKKDHPAIEVIILTGHGTKTDEQVCRELGAFAYLQKPVDIEILSKTMREAYQKIKLRQMAAVEE